MGADESLKSSLQWLSSELCECKDKLVPCLQESTEGNNFWQAAKRLPQRGRQQAAAPQKTDQVPDMKGNGAQPV